MSSPEPFDWWQPFKTVNALSPDIPHRGQPGIDKLDVERPPLEQHAEQVRTFALGIIGSEPGREDAASASKRADGLREWITSHWQGIEQTPPEFYQELEDRAYALGLLSLWWGLSGDMPKLREFLQFMRDWQDSAGHEAVAAQTRADRRESAEWSVVAQAIGNMEYQATALKSPRLKAAAKVMRAMLTADRLRPEAPAKEARTADAKKAANARRATSKELKKKILAECLKLQKGTQWKNPAARQVAPLAFKWNKEALNPKTDRPPYGWTDEAAAFTAIRRWLNK